MAGNMHGSRHCTEAETETLHLEPQTGREKLARMVTHKAFEISTAHPHWHTPNKATQCNLSPTVPPVETKHQLRAHSSHSHKPPHYYCLHLTFTDETKVNYKAAATQDTIPEAPEKGTHNGNVPSTQPSPSHNGLDSGQAAI